ELFIFFFSSRRRHTRSKRDWSSDVCSSDLGWNVVKMHTRLVVVSEDVAYPDKIVPSTGNVADVETSDRLIEEDDATYLMDRGYPSVPNLMTWQEQEISFVVRVTKSIKVVPIEIYESNHPAILRDAKVHYSYADKPIRLVEFEDEEHRLRSEERRVGKEWRRRRSR